MVRLAVMEFEKSCDLIFANNVIMFERNVQHGDRNRLVRFLLATAIPALLIIGLDSNACKSGIVNVTCDSFHDVVSDQQEELQSIKFQQTPD